MANTNGQQIILIGKVKKTGFQGSKHVVSFLNLIYFLGYHIWLFFSPIDNYDFIQLKKTILFNLNILSPVLS